MTLSIARVEATIPGHHRPRETSGPSTTATPKDRQPSAGESSRLDFTRMTRRELADWVNAEIRNGTMSLDDSSPFVAMTVKIPVDAVSGGGPIPLDDQERVDFLAMTESAIDFHRSRGETDAVARLEGALQILQDAQGRIGRLEARA